MTRAELEDMQEASNERYDTLFELHRDRLIREYQREGGEPDWKPPFATVHKIVVAVMNAEEEEAANDF